MDSELKKRVECRYSQRQCSKAAVEGFQLCRSHILEDKDSPFQQCGYVSAKTGRRCVQATLNPHKKEGLCLQHTTKLNRTRRAAAKKQQASNSVTVTSLMKMLGGYQDGELINSNAPTSQYDTVQSAMAELASSDNSDIEERTYPADSHIWQPDSDSDSIDSENEDIFKYAEVFTAEEVTRIARDKLIRLQSLYIEQFKWLHNVLREQRRQYLHCKQQSEESTITPEDTAAKGSPKVDQHGEPYKEYKATKRYHRRYGQEALMYMKSQERRRAVCNQSIVESYHHNRYRHASKHGTKYCSAKSIKCHEKSLPFTRYCIKHIENDTKQALFRRCGFEAVKGGLSCERVVINIDEHIHCDYHTSMDHRVQYTDLEVSSCSDTEIPKVEIVSTEDQQTTDLQCTNDGCNISLPEDPGTSEMLPMDTSEPDETVAVAAQIEINNSMQADEEQPEL